MKRLSAPFAATFAAAMVGAMLPLGGPAFAEDEPTETPEPSAAPTESAPARGFGGYTTGAWSAPVKIEIYEPMIPFPNTPQMELEIAYSEVKSDTSTSRGRSSFLWPGGPIGEGFKTIVEQFGLPPSLGKDGYPVQVNSVYPAGPDAETDEPFPGMIQRAGSDDGSAYAETGYSSDSQAQDRDAGEGDDGGLVPGLPLPGLDGLLGLISPPRRRVRTPPPRRSGSRRHSARSSTSAGSPRWPRPRPPPTPRRSHAARSATSPCWAGWSGWKD